MKSKESQEQMNIAFSSQGLRFILPSSYIENSGGIQQYLKQYPNNPIKKNLKGEILLERSEHGREKIELKKSEGVGNTGYFGGGDNEVAIAFASEQEKASFAQAFSLGAVTRDYTNPLALYFAKNGAVTLYHQFDRNYTNVDLPYIEGDSNIELIGNVDG